MSEILDRLARLEEELLGIILAPSRIDNQKVMEAVYRTIMLVAREVWVDGTFHTPRGDLLHSFGEAQAEEAVAAARERFPLTKRVLREEPVPGSSQSWPLYRWRDDHLEEAYGYSTWESCDVPGENVLLMRHALDLHDNPYKEVPDEG